MTLCACWASPTEEVSIRVCYESLHFAFPNNVLVSQFHNEIFTQRAVQKIGAG